MSGDRKVVASPRRSERIYKPTAVLRQPLSYVLFDHCFRNIWREIPEARRNQFSYVNCFLFRMYTMEQKRERVVRLIKKYDMLSKQYVFIPIAFCSHWSLLIFCHMNENLQSKTATPCMLLLDSLNRRGSSLRLEALIRRLVLDIFETEGRSESKDTVQEIPLLIPKVPQQRNGMECGIFVLYYLNLFLDCAPESFSISTGYPYFLKEDWFTEEELEGFYEKLESLGVESSDSEEDPDCSDSKETAIQCLVGDTWEPC